MQKALQKNKVRTENQKLQFKNQKMIICGRGGTST